jgi:F-type H+-transporting ATPase subunit gamma
MQTLEAISRRASALESIRGVVQTMKTLSAVNVPPYERAATSIATFHDTVLSGLQVVLKDLDIPTGRKMNPDAPTIAIIFGSDHGLCGAFNDEVASLALERLSGFNGTPILLAVGAKADQALEMVGRKPLETFLPPASADGLGRLARKLLVALDRIISREGEATVEIFYNRRATAVTHRPVVRHLLPVDADFLRNLSRRHWNSRVLPTYRMNPEDLFAALIRQHLFVSIFLAAAESLSAESTARLARMQQAERAINERLEDLNGVYRNARQTQITDELMDVIAGFEAMSRQSASDDAETFETGNAD